MVRTLKAPNQEPVTIALRRLFDDHNATLRGIAARTQEIDEAGRGINYTYISGLMSGREKPSPRALELLAGAFDLDPEFFIEYRMNKLRGELDPRVVGFDAAVQRFVTLTGETSKV
jgi:transcriptional regulator with XRE-family HTH domain